VSALRAPGALARTLPDPFRWWGDHVAVSLSGSRALFTTRRGGVSTGPFAALNLGRYTDDDRARVFTNRERLAALAGVDAEALADAHQVHGARVVRLLQAPRARDRDDDADGHATALRAVAPMVLTADCLPVVLAADGAVAALHAGWRGLAAGVLEQGVRALRELGAGGAVEVAIGPGAGPCCYRVGDEVRAALGEPPSASLAGNIDLKAVARRQLEAAGVTQVHDVGLCTICSPELFFSHRRDGAPGGRQAGLIWRS